MKKFIATLTVLAFAAVGCGSEKLRELRRLYMINAEPITAKVNFCTLEASKVKSNLKFIFMIDKSGSNQDGGNELGTDPDGARRYTNLISFLQNNSDDPTVFYSLINFSTDANIVQGFTNNRTSFANLVINESNPGNTVPARPSDGGWTNYLGAFTKVHQLIDNDIKAAKLLPEIISSYYVVFFISDGYPQVGTNEFQSKIDIFNTIDAFVNLEKAFEEYVDSVQLHTGYYYNTADPAAQQLVKELAERGNGDSYEFGAGQGIDFSQFAVPERNVKNTLKDIFVTNVNTVWHDGNFYLDADADSMPDDLEKELGSDPNLYDSDFNGVSDGVEFRISGKPCKDKFCSKAGAEPYLACNSYLRPDAAGKRLFKDLDKDLLNDCEERVVLKSKMDNYDSNKDWIPDDLAFRSQVAMVDGIQEASLDSDFDGFSNYTEVKLYTPVRYPNDQIIGLRPYKYNLTTTSQSAAQTCYELEVTNIAAIGPDNLIRVYILENSAIIDAKRFLRIKERRASGTSVTFSEMDFQ